MMRQIIVFCPDCRGRFDVEESDIIEGEVLECSLCGAEIEVVQEKPVRLRLLVEEEEEENDAEY